MRLTGYTLLLVLLLVAVFRHWPTSQVVLIAALWIDSGVTIEAGWTRLAIRRSSR